MIADVAKEHDLYIICDEVYREMVFDGRKITSFGFLEDIHDRLILIDSVSKRYSACGARIGGADLQERRDPRADLQTLPGPSGCLSPSSSMPRWDSILRGSA